MTRRVIPPAVGEHLSTARYRHHGAVQCRLVTDYASDMISVHDVDEGATYLFASPAAERLFGYAPADLTGRSAFEFIHPADRTDVAAFASRLREGRDIVTVRYRLRRKSGRYEWVESTCRLVDDPLTGEPAEFVATTRSAEARVAIEAEQERLLVEADRARAAAESANRTKDEFLAMMSHEFRTPLNAIAGHVQLLALGIHGPLTDAQHAALDRVDRSQRYLLRLVNDLLNVARLKAGRFADRETLVQVQLNLLSNSVKFTPAGGAVTIDAPRRAAVPPVAPDRAGRPAPASGSRSAAIWCAAWVASSAPAAPRALAPASP